MQISRSYNHTAPSNRFTLVTQVPFSIEVLVLERTKVSIYVYIYIGTLDFITQRKS